MNITLTACAITATLLIAVFLGIRVRRLIPQQHLNPETKDAVKVSTGLVATMSALVLGLLVSSAKSSYDLTRSEVIQMAAKVALFDRVLAAYGPEAAGPRADFHTAIERAIDQIWSGEGSGFARLASDTSTGNSVYIAIQELSPKDAPHQALKAQATSLLIEFAQLRTLLAAQSAPSISKLMLVIVVSWLVVIFFSFSLLAPPNTTVAVSLTIAALSVSGAILLILELDRPLSGLIPISSEPMREALVHLQK